MQMISIPREFLLPYIIFNLISLGLIVLSSKWFITSKNIIGLIFFIACFINVYVIFKNPESYFDLGKTSLLYFYKDFIYGYFKNSEVVCVLTLSTLQLFIAIALFIEGFLLKLGILFGIIFLIMIAPLGVGSAFPSTLLLAIALLIINAKRKRRIREIMQSHIL